MAEWLEAGAEEAELAEEPVEEAADLEAAPEAVPEAEEAAEVERKPARVEESTAVVEETYVMITLAINSYELFAGKKADVQ